ncbi:MAG: PQQ-dependent sugar dehydrogenase [Tateyamaria sp.]|uniref:PQQ-dependent sugar dehydrogenase n=1 Tax=Tateyamaria sp. TaxID=1929288 RepID=UPI003284466F
MKKILIVLSAAVLLLAVGGIVGAGLVHFETRPYKIAQSIAFRLDSAPAGTAQETAATTSFESTFVRLQGQKTGIALQRPISGGGMTPMEGGVLLLAGDGTFVHATSPNDVKFLEMTPPPNGFEAYQADAETRFADLTHAFKWFRYNDILAIEADGQRALVASFTRYYPEDTCYGTAIARLDLPEGSLREMTLVAEDWTTIYETQPCLPLKEIYRAVEGHAAGGRIAHDGAGNIYLGSGDYHFDGLYASFEVSQDDAYEHGKLIKIALDGSGHEIVAKGLRNMQGVAWFGGEVWAVEHGMRGGDELNRIVNGRNYGWPVVTLGTQYNRHLMPGTNEAAGRHEGFDKPVFSWLPSVAISSLNVIENVHPAWDGDLLMASLGGNALFRIRLEGDRVLFAERIAVGVRVRYAQPIEGGVVLWSDARELIFLKATDIFDGDPLEIALSSLELSLEEREVLNQTFNGCIECHAVVAGEHGNAPSLGLLYGRAVASTGFEGYSDALRQVDGVWTRDRLIAYLDDPQGFAPGTQMPDLGLDDQNILARVADLIEALADPE